MILFIHTVFAANNPDAAIMNARLGLAYLSKNLYTNSKRCLLIALREDSRIPETWYSMAYFLEKTNHLRAANSYYQKAIKINPHSGAARNNYGAFLCRQHQFANAIQEFVLATREPNYLHSASAYRNAAICASRIPNEKLAEYFFKKARENDPGLAYS